MKFSRPSKTVQIVLVVIFVLIAIRAALPWAVKTYVNGVLEDDIEGYTGRVEDVDLSLWRGAYQLERLTLQRVEGKIPHPFLDFQHIDLAIAWGPIFRGQVVGNVVLEKARVNLTAGPTEAETQTGTEGEGWQSSFDKIFPLRVNEFRIRNSSIHYIDEHRTPKVDVALEHIDLSSTNLGNISSSQGKLDSSIAATAIMQKTGRLSVEAKTNIHAQPLAYDIDLKLEDLELPGLNDFFKAYAAFDVKTGRLSLFAEAASEKGYLKGYVKPLLTNVDVIQLGESIDSPQELLSELLVSQVNLFIRRYSKDEVGTKIPFEGRVDSVDVGVLNTIGNLFKHAFLKDLEPKVDAEITESTLGEARKRSDI